MRPQDIIKVIEESSESIKFINGLDDCYVTTMVIGTNQMQYLVRVDYGVEQGGHRSEFRTISKNNYTADYVKETDDLFIPYFVCPNCGNTHLRVIRGDAVVKGNVESIHIDGMLKYYEEEIVYGVGADSDTYQCSRCEEIIATGGQESLYVAVNEYAELVDEYDKFIDKEDDFWNASAEFTPTKEEDDVIVPGYDFKCPKCKCNTITFSYKDTTTIIIRHTGEKGVVGMPLVVGHIPNKKDIKVRCHNCNKIVKKSEIRWNL